MKHRFTFFAVMMMALAIPQNVKAYDFSYTYQSKTLYYVVVNGDAFVTYPGNGWTGDYSGYTAPSGNIVIPDSVLWNGSWIKVSGIKQGTFTSSTITTITIPTTIRTIERDAFPTGYGNVSLNAVYYKGSLAEWCNINFENIYSNPLYCGRRLYINNQLVTNLIIPEGVDTIKNYSFIHMTTGSIYNAVSYLDTIILPSTLRYIGRYAFEWDYYEKHLTIPDSVNYIGYCAFNYGIYGDVTLPTSLDTIREYTFQGCRFSSITLPEKLKYIGDGALSSCNNLQYIEIPESVEYIGNRAFGISSSISSGIDNSKLSRIILKRRTPPIITNETFQGNWRDVQTGQTYYSTLDWVTELPVSIFVPCQSVDAYRHAMYWDSLANNIYPMEVCQWDVTVQSNNDTLGSTVGTGTYSDGQNLLIYALSRGGMSFIGWQDGLSINPRQISVVSDTVFTAVFAVRDTTIINDTLTLTEYVPVHDTTYINIHDTTYIDVPYAVHDTTILVDTLTLTEYVPVHDTTYINIFDTTYIDVPYAVHDTTIVIDTLTLTENVPVHDTTYINVHDTTYVDVLYAVYDTTVVVDTLLLTEYVPIHDTTYINIHDTTYIDVPYAVHDTTILVDTLALTEYIPVHDTTYINIHDTTYIALTDTVTNTIYDTVTNTVLDTVTNTIYDTTVVYNTDTLWLHDTVFVHDTLYIYDTIYVGVDDVETISAKIYTSNGQIVVDGAQGNAVWLYDVNGRILATKQDEYSPMHFNVNASGTYLVKIGNHSARKVVVIR
ncbi:MAG: leucine-rich repeat domain-containing protein [Bacteroidales bacterium]|nr:leucine-rich repeat domain-containing protein [Bacteroidales bacterium]